MTVSLCHWFSKGEGQNDWVEPQDPLSSTFMEFGRCVYHTRIYKKVSWGWQAKLNEKSAILNSTAIFYMLCILTNSWTIYSTLIKFLCAFSTALGPEVMEIFNFGLTVWAWQECFTVNNEICVPSVYFILHAPNLKHFPKVPAWTHLHANIHSRS